MPLTFVPVVFELELPFLELQARSFARFVAPELVGEVIVVDNSRHGIPARRARAIMSAYGRHAERVRIVPGRQIADPATSLGWTSQQVLKLAVAKLVTTPRYVALDAKNIFVAPLAPAYLESADGRARVGAHPYTSHPLRESLVRVLDYFDLPTEETIQQFPATVTPYVLYTEDVVTLMAEVERREQATFSRAFVQRGFTEFFLYAAWIMVVYRDRSVRYAEDQPGCPTVWPSRATLPHVEEAVDGAASGDFPVLSVHRTALMRLDEPSVRLLCEFWARVGLFDTSDAAVAFVAEYRKYFSRRVWVKRVREAPARVARGVHRKVRS
ncbi:hypothetical protein D1825_06310 [Cellulomonas rhizosphaerae]|uniref:Uncharacterized protein n=1 Tax=Cellulomonas rhizosphaerae TaxID=2293719 RepID=A0A413RNC5_9CELL|nr:hypothetical protein D1825_06310 [Cellulomonas rhizosphaerae]